MATQVIMPALGESVIEGTIGRWLKQVGDSVKEMEPLLEVESDKVNTEIPSPASGVILALNAAEGEVVQAGSVIAMIGAAGEAVGAAAPQPVMESAKAATASAAASAPVHAEQHGGNGGPRVSPVVANIAAQYNVDVHKISGTGLGGRVTKKDILAFVEGGASAAPAPAPAMPSTPAAAPADHIHKAPPAAGRPGELIQLSTMRKRIAEHMVLSKLKTAPHVTTVFEADMSAVVAHREANKAEYADRGSNLTFTAYFMLATARALRVHPMVNSQWTDEGVLLHRDVNIGMATAIEEGLIVPVVRNADELSLAGLARAINDLSARARKSQLKADEVSGGTFTITNHGVSGSLFATPIINQPQTGILGVGALQKRVMVMEGDMIAIRPMVYLSLTFDHRVLDGAGADWFMVEVKNQLENWAE
jgi:2-oxoglutarate dehydrogenase E2 component (dihydrolipoamide succinyltransferase)